MTTNSPRSTQDAELGATTVERALKVVGDILDAGGEASLRLADVSRRSGVSVGSLYHHFGSREGLISAARERQFSRSLPARASEETAYLMAASTPSEFLDRFGEVLREGDDPQGAAGRRRRFEMIGSAARRPGHLGGIVEMQGSYLDLYEEVARTLEKHGWLPDDVDVRAVALLLHATSMGRVLLEIDTEPVSLDKYHQVVRTVLNGLVAERAPAASRRRAS